MTIRFNPPVTMTIPPPNDGIERVSAAEWRRRGGRTLAEVAPSMPGHEDSARAEASAPAPTEKGLRGCRGFSPERSPESEEKAS
jgi:hypothetical protein